MNELKRQAYLRAMDIQIYFPRIVLVGAKSSPDYGLPHDYGLPPDYGLAPEDLPPEDSPPEGLPLERKTASPLVDVTSMAGSLDAVKQLRSTVASNRKESVSRIRPSVTVSPKNGDVEQTTDSNRQPAHDAEESSELRFKLLYFKINDELAVIDEVPDQVSDQSSDQSNKESLVLLRAILKALGQDTGEADLAAEVFSWPLAGYAMKKSTSVEAGKALSGFLQMRHETDNFSNLLVFAGQVENLLPGQKLTDSAHDFDAGKGYYITVTSSLHSILAVPALKRGVWQQLQTLKKRMEQSI